MSYSSLYLKGVGMNITSYKELLLFLYLENSSDMYVKIEKKKYLISLNKKNWYPIKKRIGKQLINQWGIELCE